jgi:hypothetical protein
MSSRKIIEAARALVKGAWVSDNGLRSVVNDDDFDDLKAAIKEHDDRWAEFHKTPITGGG